MNVNLSQDVSQGDSNTSSSKENLSSDDLVRSSNSNHPDNKKRNLAFVSCPSNNQQSNDSVFDIELSKSQGSGYHKGYIGMEYDEHIDVNREIYNRLAVHSIVVSDLFPRIKFLDKYKDLKYSSEEGTICHYVLEKCQLNYDSNRRKFFRRRPRSRLCQVSKG